MLGGLLVALHLIPGGIEFQAGYPASQDRLVDPVTAHSQHPYDIAQVTVGSAGLIVFELPENDSLDRSNLDPLAFDVANDTVLERPGIERISAWQVDVCPHGCLVMADVEMAVFGAISFLPDDLDRRNIECLGWPQRAEPSGITRTEPDHEVNIHSHSGVTVDDGGQSSRDHILETRPVEGAHEKGDETRAVRHGRAFGRLPSPHLQTSLDDARVPRLPQPPKPAARVSGRAGLARPPTSAGYARR